MVEISEEDFRMLWDMVLNASAGYVDDEKRTENGEVVWKDGIKILELTEDGKFMCCPKFAESELFYGS